MFITKCLFFILVSFESLSTKSKPCGLQTMVNMNFLLRRSNCGSATTSSPPRVHMPRGNVFTKNHDPSPITRGSQPSRSAACKKGNIRFVESFRLSLNSFVNTCGTECKSNDSKPRDSCKSRHTVPRTIDRARATYRADPKGDLSQKARLAMWREHNNLRIGAAGEGRKIWAGWVQCKDLSLIALLPLIARRCKFLTRRVFLFFSIPMRGNEM
jgi:hypothetical protein